MSSTNSRRFRKLNYPGGRHHNHPPGCRSSVRSYFSGVERSRHAVNVLDCTPITRMVGLIDLIATAIQQLNRRRQLAQSRYRHHRDLHNFQTNRSLASNHFRIIVRWIKIRPSISTISLTLAIVSLSYHHAKRLLRSSRTLPRLWIRRTFWHHHFTVNTQHRAGERTPCAWLPAEQATTPLRFSA